MLDLNKTANFIISIINLIIIDEAIRVDKVVAGIKSYGLSWNTKLLKP